MSADLRVTLVTKSGARYEGVRVQGAGGLLPVAGGWERLQKALSSGSAVLIWTTWTATAWTCVSVPAADIAQIGGAA